MFRKLAIVCTVVFPCLAIAQMSIVDASYRLEAVANSGTSHGSQTIPVSSTGALQSNFHQANAYANQPPSSVHSFSNVSWNCTPTDLDAGLVACWDSVDFGAGNSGHMLSRLYLTINLNTVSAVSTLATFDPSNSIMEIDSWNGFTWVPLVSSTQITSYSSIWNPGNYRLHGERLYNPVGNSTGCVPLSFHMHAEPVPEPSTISALLAGAVAMGVRRRRK